ncbi:MAG: hypothetical protein KGP08_09230 [Xanthomonadaceae bacterium]|nr:hypothetical protein [Xanthomonadaceae bacterium]
MTGSRMTCRIRIFLIAGAMIHAQVGNAQMMGSGALNTCQHLSGRSESQFLPGSYFKIRATELLDKGDATGALEAFEHAAYYGNRIAQHDMAMMYLKGASKIPSDAPLGVAWLKEAAKYGYRPSIEALKKLEPALSPDQREQAEREFQKLDVKYSPAATQKRVMSAFQLERMRPVRVDWICQEDGEVVPAEKYYAQVDQDFADYVTAMYGKVTVEPVEQSADSNAKK